jgi:hypothetical protein
LRSFRTNLFRKQAEIEVLGTAPAVKVIDRQHDPAVGESDGRNQTAEKDSDYWNRRPEKIEDTERDSHYDGSYQNNPECPPPYALNQFTATPDRG